MRHRSAERESARRGRHVPAHVLCGFAGSLTVLITLGLAWAASGLPTPEDGWYQDRVHPGAWPTVLALAAAATACFLSYWLPRRSTDEPFTLLVGGWAAASAAVLGLSSYLPCDPGQVPGLTAARWTLSLFLGTVEDPWAAGTCSGARPLAADLSALLALVTTFVGLGAVLLAVTRQRWDRLRVRWSRDVVVVAGVDSQAGALLRAVIDQHDHRVAVVDPALPRALVSSARAARAAVVTGDLSDVRTARLALVSRRRVSARAVYLLDPDAEVNLQRLEVLEGVLQDARERRDHGLLRIVVRIDDPWQVDEWRRAHRDGPGGCLLDALSGHETTARLLLDRLDRDGVRHVVLTGSSPLTMAVLGELAQRRREAAALGTLPVPQDGRADAAMTVTVLAEDASDVVGDHALLQERYGNPADDDVRALDARPREDVVLKQLMHLGDRTAVVVTDEPSPASLRLAARVAARCRRVPVHVWSGDAEGVAGIPLRGLLRPFRTVLTTEDGRLLEGSWDRVARLLHEGYRHRSPSSGEPGRPWDRIGHETSADQLPRLYKDSNVRQIRNVLVAAEDLSPGFSWGAVDPAVPRTQRHFDVAEVDDLAAADHASWCAYLTAHKWRTGERDDARRRHPHLLPWGDLPEAARERSRSGVRDCLALLGVLGYQLLQQEPDLAGGAEGWRAFARSGSVRAERLTEAWVWRTDGGDQMRARPGDWRLTDETGRQWSVQHDRFTSSYRRVDEGVYERSGLVRARRGRPGERVTTLEGPAVVGPGEWVVEGEVGDLWTVPQQHFSAHYVAVEDPRLSTAGPVPLQR